MTKQQQAIEGCVARGLVRHREYEDSLCSQLSGITPVKDLLRLIVSYLPLSDPLLWFEEELLLETFPAETGSIRVMQWVIHSQHAMCRRYIGIIERDFPACLSSWLIKVRGCNRTMCQYRGDTCYCDQPLTFDALNLLHKNKIK